MSKRGTGRTTRAMQNAPEGAVYIWCNPNLRYPRDLATKIGRDDLKIVSPGWLENDQWRGLNLKGIVTDHACQLTVRQYDGLLDARARIRNVQQPSES